MIQDPHAGTPDITDGMTHEEAYEPARTIASTFADKVMVKTIVSAIVALVAGMLKVTVDDDVVDNIVTVVMFAFVVITPLVANHEQGTLAKQQGEDTRKAVYAPATVQNLTDEAYAAGVPPTEPKPDLPAPPADNQP